MFGEIKNSEMRLNEFGLIVKDAWIWLSSQYSYVLLDEYQIMPNHFHGILWIKNKNPSVVSVENHGGGSRTALPGQQKPVSGKNITVHKIKPVGRLIGAFKTVSTKQINIIRQTPGAYYGSGIFTIISAGMRRTCFVTGNIYEIILRNGNQTKTIPQNHPHDMSQGRIRKGEP
ncbi:MAG: hypothetical protein JXA71_04620 [Chitinispirillaceae bacterium]|nr:hypothetical protein [Chitinispirillaceae bacterium]